MEISSKQSSHHKKIAIVGKAGSGKTTLAFRLQQKTNLPLYHLDQYYWLPQWNKREFAEFSALHNQLCAKDAWIIEGSYVKLFVQRAEHADIIIFLDLPRSVCIWHVIKRSFLNFGNVIPGNPSGCKQHFFTIKFLRFLQWIWSFNKRYRKTVLNILHDAQLNDKKQIHVLTSVKAIEEFVERFKDLKTLYASLDRNSFPY